MRKKITPKLFALAAILLTAFYTKAPENHQLFLGASPGDMPLSKRHIDKKETFGSPSAENNKPAHVHVNDNGSALTGNSDLTDRTFAAKGSGNLPNVNEGENTPAMTLTCPQNITANATSGSGATVTYGLPVVTGNCQQCTLPSTLPGFNYLGELNGHKYFRSNFNRNWPQANDTATALGGHLVTINSEAESNFLSGGEAWIGLTDRAVEGTFVWVTGEPVAYTNWWPGQPNNGGTGGDEDYVFMNFYGTTKWVDQATAYFYPFIVEFECSATPVPTQTAGLPSGSVFPIGVTTNSFTYTDGCNNTATCSFTVNVVINQSTTITCPQNISVNATNGAGMVVNYAAPVIEDNCQQCNLPTSVPGFTYLGEYGGHRYFRSNFDRFWKAARDTALALGGHLATVTSEGENTFLTSNVETWIGLTDEAVEGTFQWVTGEPFSYSNWFPGNPNNTGGDEDHVYMNFYGTNKWVDHNEFTPLKFVIEFECTTTPTPTQTSGLPSGSVFPVGVTTNSFSYTDGCSNTVNCSFTVTVNYNQTTVLTCPTNISVNATNSSGAIANYSLPVITTSCTQCNIPTSLPGFTHIGSFGGHEYFRSTFTRTWSRARDTAVALGAHLVTITSAAENNFLTGGEAWIGLTDEAVEGTFTWVTGEPFVYNNFWPGEPNNGGAGGNEDYVYTNFFGTTRWVDFGTAYFKPFIIEFECTGVPIPTQTAGLPSGSVFPVGVTTNSFTYTDGCNNTATCSFTVTVVNNLPTTITCPGNITENATSGSGTLVNYSLPVVDDNCQQCNGPTTLPGFTYIGELDGHRYFRSNFERFWQEAKDSAQALGAHLATVTSATENTFLAGGEAWIGLTDEALEGTFKWVTGEPFVYSNWFPGNPNNSGGIEDHVFMNFFGTNTWVDHNEFEPKQFIIEFECSANPAPTQTAGLPSGSVFPVGVTTNSFTYTDACANTVTCSFTVTVVNNLPTSIACPQNIVLNTTSSSGQTVNYNLPVISDNCTQCTLPTSIPGYTYIGDLAGHKYFRSNFSKPWTQAKDSAINLGGHLATVTSEAENDFLFGPEAWIGLTDEVLEGTFVWVTGEPFVYSSWYPGNPNNTNNEDYVLMNFYGTHQWVDHDGSVLMPFIVEFECTTSAPVQTAGLPSGSVFPVGVTTNSFSYTDACNNTVTCSFTVTLNYSGTTVLNCPQNISVNATSNAGATVSFNPPVITGTCPQCTGATTLPGFTYIGEFSGHRYFRSNFTRTWAGAKDTAQRLGSHLVTITSEAENNFLAGSGEAWIGLTDEAVEGTFAWVTGEPFAYTNFWPGEPNNGGAGGNEDYVYTNFFGTTKWVDYGTAYFYPFIIEFECSTAPVPTQTAGLPSGSVFPIGVTTNSFTYTDACSSTVTCSFTVTVVNNLPTTITCPGNISANATNGSGAVVSYNLPVVVDNCQQCNGPTSLAGFTYIGEFGGHRYFRSNFDRFWQDAKDTAIALGAHLATITSAGENSFLIGGEAWIGLTDEAVEGTFEWVTGEPFVYSDWFGDNPNNTGGIEDHVFMNFYGTNQWVDHDEFTLKQFIIEFECSANPAPTQTAGLPSGSLFPVGVTTNSFSYTNACANTVTCSFTVTVNNNQPTTMSCPQNIQVNTTSGAGATVSYNPPVVTDFCPQCNGPATIQDFTYVGAYGGHRYFRSNFNRTWQQAKDLAIGLGAHLATVTSAGENVFLAGVEAWIGLTDEAVEGTFVWVTGEPFVYSNWFGDNPNNTGGIEDHVFMNFYGTNQWVDHDGTEPKQFIIEFECTATPTQTAGLPSGAVFPVGVTTNSFSYTDACNTTVTCSFTVTVNLTPTRYSRVGIEQPENEMQITNTVPAKELEVRAYPNPSAGDFNLQVFSSSDEPVTIRILDVTGMVKKVFNMNSNTKTLKAGADLARGIYMAEVIQGNRKQIVKLVKLN